MKAFVVIGYAIASLNCGVAIGLALVASWQVWQQRVWIAGTPMLLLITALVVFLAGASIGFSAETIRRGESSRRDAGPQRGGRL